MRPLKINVTPKRPWEKAAWERAAGPATFVPCGATAVKAVQVGKLNDWLWHARRFFHPRLLETDRDMVLAVYRRELKWSGITPEEIYLG